MATGSLVSVSEYLSTAYHPDCDYVDGVIEERNLGEKDHARLQTRLSAQFYNHEQEWGVSVVVEQRVQVTPTRFRVPDICVVRGELPDEQIFRTPPFICIEILSPEDRLSRLEERMTDYLHFGVPYVFLLNPETRKAHRWTLEGMHEVKELRTEDPEIVIPVAQLFG